MTSDHSDSLDDIALKYPTDKSSIHHNYTEYYQQILGPRRYMIRGLLELGVGIWSEDKTKWGPSLRMWRDWLPNAQIVGLDQHPAPHADFGERIAFVQADQCSKSGLDHALESLNNLVDVIIDDASHINKLTISTFTYLFPKLAPGGVYFIEDTTASNSSDIFPGNNYHELEDFIIVLWRALHFNYRCLHPSQCADFFKNDPDATMTFLERWTERVDMIRGIIAIHKRGK